MSLIDESNNIVGRGKCLGIIYSTGDIGDVGRHAVEAALELPINIISSIKVFSINGSHSLLKDTDWKCGCRLKHNFCNKEENCLNRIQIINIDCTKDCLSNYLINVDAIVSCLGNRKPFHPDCIAKKGTERIINAMLNNDINRIVMLSSVGISNDWPPMEWSKEGDRLQAFFRTICWRQYQDLTGAELAVQIGGIDNDKLDYLITRSVMLSENTIPINKWYIQNKKYHDHPVKYMAKMDCARFMVEEAINPSYHRAAVVIGGMPKNYCTTTTTTTTIISNKDNPIPIRDITNSSSRV